MIEKKKFFLFLFVLFFFLICVPKKEKVVVLYDRPPRTFDPHLRNEIVTISILSNIYEALVDYTPDLRLVPGLARAWYQKDSLTWIFNLKERVYFHNGKELGSDDVVYSLYRPTRISGAEAGALGRIIDTIYGLNNHTVVIKTKIPFYFLLNELNHLYIIPNDFVDFNHPVGTGPYKVKCLSQDSVCFELNERYWGNKPKIKEGVFKFIPDLKERIQLLRNGSAEIVYGVPIEYYQKLKDSIKMLIMKGVATRYIQFDIKVPPFDNKRLRQAISLSINREGVVRDCYYGIAEPANQYIPEGVIGYCSNLPQLSYNPDSARKIIKKIKKVKVNFYYGKPIESLGKKITDYLKAVGIEAKGIGLAQDEFWSGIEKRQFNLYLLSSLITTLDGLNGIIEPAFYTFNPKAGEGLMNRSGYSNKLIDSLIKSANAVKENEERMLIIDNIQRLLLDDMPIVPIVWEPRIYGVADFIEFKPRLDQTIRLTEIGFRK